MKKLILLALASLFSVSMAFAQLGSLSVTVVAGDVPVAGALVNVEGDGHGHNRPHFNGVTDEFGMILFPDIPVMDYEVTAGVPGIQPVHVHDVAVLEGETTEVTLELPSFEPAPRISVRPDDLHFGPVGVGTTFTRHVDIENRGQLDLTVSLALEGEAFGFDYEAEFTVLPGEEVELPVTFTPADTLPYEGLLTITSNDPEHGVIEVELNGFGANIITGGLSVDVIVVDSLGESSAVDSARVRVSFIRDHGGPRPHHFLGFTDENGHLDVPELPIGIYNVNASKPGIGFASEVVEITEDQTAFVTLSLVAADSSEHGGDHGRPGGHHHFEIVDLAGTVSVTTPDSANPDRVLYALDVDADGIVDYRLNFGPPDYVPDNGLVRPSDGEEITVTGALMSHGDIPMVHVHLLNGEVWWEPNPMNDGEHGGDGGGRAEGFGCDNGNYLTWVEVGGTVVDVEYAGALFYGVDNNNDNVADYVIDFGDSYNPSNPAIPSLGQYVYAIGGMLQCGPETLDAEWVIVYEVNGTFFRMPGDTEGLYPIEGSSVGENPSYIPVSHLVATNYPNPFNPTTTIEFSIPSNGLVTLTVFDVLGREVTTLVNENLTAGAYTTTWNAASLPSGMYMYRISINEQSIVNKMLLLK
ncbi:MAG: T9SS type A sorting domain-containing protein [Calditrichaeota bacterium]|nr:T9SS type A sorting domain-containing protein [Calditrichota bacterium]MCB9367080.1 T9SS type A sorting domain-containing protein [Calditrichota bacterium]MCB9391436.1 T9SS type A sorting domain-containing protein [Calditrichota bacterium]